MSYTTAATVQGSVVKLLFVIDTPEILFLVSFLPSRPFFVYLFPTPVRRLGTLVSYCRFFSTRVCVYANGSITNTCGLLLFLLVYYARTIYTYLRMVIKVETIGDILCGRCRRCPSERKSEKSSVEND